MRDFSFFFVIVLHNSAVSMCIRAFLYCRRLQNAPVAASKTGHFCQFRTICLKQPCIALKEGCACGLAHCKRRSHARGGCLTFENVLPLRAHVHNRDTAHSIGKRLSLPSGWRMLANQTLEGCALSLYAQAAGVLCQKATLPALAGNAGAPCLLRQQGERRGGNKPLPRRTLRKTICYGIFFMLGFRVFHAAVRGTLWLPLPPALWRFP